MSDIFREVEEEVKRDQAAQFLKKYGNLIGGVLVALVIGVGGYRGYEFWQQKQAAEAGQKFEAALQLQQDGKAAEAKAQFEDLARSAPEGYRLLSRFRLAADTAKADPAAGIKAYEALAADTTIEQTLRDLATVRGAMLQVDTLPFAELRGRLDGLAQQGKAWRLSAREVLGLAAYKAGNLDEAGKSFEAILADPEASQTTRQRAEVMMSLIRGGAAPAK